MENFDLHPGFRLTPWVDLHQEIQKEGSRYVRYTLRNAQTQSPLASPVLAKEKDTVASAKIDAAYAEIDKLAAEKLGLAERIVELITRARARLDHDVSRVLVLQGEPPDVLSGYSNLGGGSFTLGGRNPVGQINESLRNAFAGAVVGLGPGDVLPLSPVAQAAAADTHKNKSNVFYYDYDFIRSLMTRRVGRRLGLSVSSSSIKLPSPAPYAPSQRSRLSQAHSRNSPARGRRGASLFGMDEVDAEGEEDYDENGDNGDDGEDKEIYCFCRKLSYGEVSGIMNFFAKLRLLNGCCHTSDDCVR